MKIRKMTKEEYLSAEKIYQKSPFLDPDPLPFDEERAKRTYEKLKNTFGIFVNEKVVGYLSLKPDGEIGILMLNDNFKNKGYGTKAIEKAVEIAKENGIKTVFAETDERNLPMRRIFEKLNFTEIKKFKKIVLPDTTEKTFIKYEKSHLE